MLIYAACVAIVFGSPSFVRADESADLQSQIDQKNQEIKQLVAQAQKYREEIATRQHLGKTLKDELARVDATIKELRQEIAVASLRLKRTQLEIQKLNGEIHDKQVSIGKLRNGLAGLMQVMAKIDGIPLLEALLANNALSDFLKQFDHSAMIQKEILGSLDKLRALEKDLQGAQAKATQKKDELKQLNDNLKNQTVAELATKRDRTQLLVETKSQEKKYQDLLQEQEARRAALEDEVRGIEAKLGTRVDMSILPAHGSGVLGYPLPDLLLSSCISGISKLISCITQYFGYTSFAAIGSYGGKGHNGVDFRALVGTSVRAAANGVVVGVGDTDVGCRGASYGKWILLEHPNHLATLYGHLSASNVSLGESIARGDTIALSGKTGYATGPHLHFGLFAAQAVKVQSIRSKVCGRLMTLPISPLNGYLNPLDYL